LSDRVVMPLRVFASSRETAAPGSIANMNIGIFTDCYLPTKNGVTTAIVQARQELERRGHAVSIFTVAGPGAGGQEPRTHRIPSLPFNRQIELRLGLPLQAAIDRIAEREKLDIIHTHTEFSIGWAGRRAAQRAGLPLIHTLHTLYPAYRHYAPLGHLLPDRAISGFLAALLAPYDLAICPSEKGRAYLTSCGQIVPVTVIGNGASADRFDPDRVTTADRQAMAAALGLDPADRVILYAGRLAEEKRVLALLGTLRPLLQADERCKLLLAGAGPAAAQLAAAARVWGLSRQVLLAGPLPWERMPQVYTLAHVFATASLSEIHPMTLIEALMCGLPIVVRRDASFVDLVRNGYNGFLADSDEEIGPRVAAILQDAALHRGFAAQARALSAQFTVEAHVDRLERLYRQVIDVHRA